jgi:hypothetical protein
MGADPKNKARTPRVTVGEVDAWASRFEGAMRRNREAREILEAWIHIGIPREFIVRAISLYCLAPHYEQQQRYFENVFGITALSEETEAFASKIQSFLRSGQNAAFFKQLQAVNDLDVEFLPGCHMSFAQALQSLPPILNKLARFTAMFEKKIAEGFSDRKTAMNRALVWLYLAIEQKSGATRYQVCKELVPPLAIGFEVSEEDTLGPLELRAIDQRIRRFMRSHEDEFQRIKDHLQTTGFPAGKKLVSLVQSKRPAYSPSSRSYGTN